MNKRTVIVLVLAFTLLIAAPQMLLGGEEEIEENIDSPDNAGQTEGAMDNFQKINSWLAKKGDLIESGKPYDLVMTGWFASEEASQLEALNPDVVLLAGLSATWVWDNED